MRGRAVEHTFERWREREARGWIAQARPLRLEVNLILPREGQGGGLHTVAVLFFEIGLILPHWGEGMDCTETTTSPSGEFDTSTTVPGGWIAQSGRFVF